MRIIWSDFASKSLSSIYKYYKIEAGEKVADKLRKEIFEATKQLIRYPQSGQIEVALQSLSQNHRYLVQGNYKIIYKPIIEGILITDIFDARQNPSKLANNSIRNLK